MRLDSIIVDLEAPIHLTPTLPSKKRASRALRASHRSTPDDHSEVVPLLPIPNRTVKRRHADDSTELPCESRSLSGTHQRERPDHSIGPLSLWRPVMRLLRRFADASAATRPAGAANAQLGHRHDILCVTSERIDSAGRISLQSRAHAKCLHA